MRIDKLYLTEQMHIRLLESSIYVYIIPNFLMKIPRLNVDLPDLYKNVG